MKVCDKCNGRTTGPICDKCNGEGLLSNRGDALNIEERRIVRAWTRRNNRP